MSLFPPHYARRLISAVGLIALLLFLALGIVLLSDFLRQWLPPKAQVITALTFIGVGGAIAAVAYDKLLYRNAGNDRGRT